MKRKKKVCKKKSGKRKFWGNFVWEEPKSGGIKIVAYSDVFKMSL